MKKNDFNQMKNSDIKELLIKVKTLKAEIADLVMDKNSRKLKDLKAISKKRKDVSQVLTIVKQKQIMSDLEKLVSKKGGK